MLSLKREVRPGRWHLYLRPGAADDSHYTAELATIHDNGFDVFANTGLGLIAIDSGLAEVFDARCPEWRENLNEGVRPGRGAVASTGLGDGTSPVFGGEVGEEVVKLRIRVLSPPEPSIDSTMASRGSARKYSAKEHFKLGDTVEHPTFGMGTAVSRHDTKVNVQFAEQIRVLVSAGTP